MKQEEPERWSYPDADYDPEGHYRPKIPEKTVRKAREHIRRELDRRRRQTSGQADKKIWRGSA